MVLMSLNKNYQQCLMDIAKRSIENGLLKNKPLRIDLSDFPKELTQYAATFVTLEKHHQLRGCIGMLKATRALVEDVAENAYLAAFKDPRFPPLSKEELKEIDIHISILTAPELMSFKSEQDLLNQLQPHIDGLILEDKNHRGTFLPLVWDHLPEPKEFLRNLKQKAGLAPDYWSNDIIIYRYQAEIIN